MLIVQCSCSVIYYSKACIGDTRVLNADDAYLQRRSNKKPYVWRVCR